MKKPRWPQLRLQPPRPDTRNYFKLNKRPPNERPPTGMVAQVLRAHINIPTIPYLISISWV
jgi:hypothetical protein